MKVHRAVKQLPDVNQLMIVRWRTVRKQRGYYRGKLRIQWIFLKRQMRQKQLEKQQYGRQL